MMFYCAYCGKPVEPCYKYCPSCGKYIGDISKHLSNKINKPSTSSLTDLKQQIYNSSNSPFTSSEYSSTQESTSPQNICPNCGTEINEECWFDKELHLMECPECGNIFPKDPAIQNNTINSKNIIKITTSPSDGATKSNDNKQQINNSSDTSFMPSDHSSTQNNIKNASIQDTCPNCGAEINEECWFDKELHLMECPECGNIFPKDPSIKNDFMEQNNIQKVKCYQSSAIGNNKKVSFTSLDTNITDRQSKDISLTSLISWFSFTGKLSRTHYITQWLILWIISLLAHLLNTFLWNKPYQTGGYYILLGLYGIPLILSNLSITVRRLESVGKSRWLSLFILIPIISFFLFIYLCIKKDKK